MKLAIDLDGVCCNFNLSYAQLFLELTGECKFPVDWKKRLEEGTFPAVWSYEEAAGYSEQQIHAVWKNITDSPTFWAKLQAYPGTKETLTQLNAFARAGDEVYFMTARRGFKAKAQTEKWLYENGVDFPTVLLSQDKLPLIKNLKVGFFIDDRPETIHEVSEWAMREQKQIHIFLQKQPYNEGVYANNVRPVESLKRALQEVGLWVSR